MVDVAAIPGTPGPTPERARLIVALTLRLGSALLGSGAGTGDIERTMRGVAGALGLHEIHAVVTFNQVAVSYALGPHADPITQLRIVRERAAHYERMTAASALAREIRTGAVSLEDAPARLDVIEKLRSPWPQWIVILTMGLLAASASIVFGGSVVDAAVAFVIGALVQPAAGQIDRTGLPPFFRKLFGPFLSALGVIAALGIARAMGFTIGTAADFGVPSALPLHGSLVLAGVLLRWLPGSNLVAGARDLIGQSIISGSSRLAEAFLFALTNVGGLIAAIWLGSMLGITLEVQRSGAQDWLWPIRIVAAAVVCATYAVRLGEPRSTLARVSVVGGVGYAIFLAVQMLGGDIFISPFVAAIGIGFLGHWFARRAETPLAMWVVPADLILLPGSLLVRGLLEAQTPSGITLLVDAAAIGFIMGIGTAAGDAFLTTLESLHEGVVRPTIDRIDRLGGAGD